MPVKPKGYYHCTLHTIQNDKGIASIQRLSEKMSRKGGLRGSHGSREVPLYDKSSIIRSLQVTSEGDLYLLGTILP